MKQKLLLIVALIFSFPALSQTTANTPPNLFQCGNEVFNLNTQTPIVLGTQNAADYTVAYFQTYINAVNNINALNASFFVGAVGGSVVFVRVTSLADSTYDIASFNVSWLPFQTGAGSMADVTACDAFILPPPVPGNGYYYDIAATMPAHIITQTATIYVVPTNANACYQETSFEVTIVPEPVVENVADVSACDSYVLPALAVGNYYSLPNGAGAIIPAGSVITTSMTVYVYVEAGNCSDETSFQVTIGGIEANNPTPLVTCTDMGFATVDLTTKIMEITGGDPSLVVTFHETQTDASFNANPILPATAYTMMANPQMLFVRVESLSGSECFTIVGLQLVAQPCTNNVISGIVRYDYDNNGCTATDGPAQNIPVANTNGSSTIYAYTDNEGHYTFTNVPEGTNTVTIQSGGLPDSFDGVNPESHEFVFTGTQNSAGGNFCITSSVPMDDLVVHFVPTSVARPGFVSTYALYCYNAGNSATSTGITLHFDPTKIEFVGASQQPTETGSTLEFYTDELQPLHTFIIYMNFMVKPTVTTSDMLHFHGGVPVAGDHYPDDNTFSFDQPVVNSYDPNDITVSEGALISEAQANDYLHYTVRFQNTGTADAVNIRIENALDANLDWLTFRPIGASHDYQAEMVDGVVTFRFNDINLPAEQDDEPASHGFVSYKVKPVAGFAVGDVITNAADIYFDFNAAIVTDPVTTQIELLGTLGNETSLFRMYPNPASGMVTLQGDFTNDVSVNVFDIQGKLILKTSGLSFDVSGMESGMYFVKVTADGKSATQKLIVN